MRTRTNTRSKPNLLLLGLAVLAVLAVAGLRAGPAPDIWIESDLPGIGPRTPVTVRAVENGRGLSTLRVELVQGDQREVLAEREFEPRPAWAFWGPRVTEDEIVLEIGSETLPNLQEGEAVVTVHAGRAPSWLRRPSPVLEELKLPVHLTPPSLVLVSQQNYVTQGGSGVVTYRPGPRSVRDGVRVGELFFPGYPLPGATGGRFAFFAAPHDFTDASQIRLVTVDELGNEAQTAFLQRFRERPLRTDEIRLSDGFMQRVLPEILAQSPGMEDRGGLLANYLMVNGELRRANAASLAELASRSRPELLWSEPFQQQPGSGVMASFAERRSYMYQGREVDTQDHLGFDLASVRQAPIVAANDGVVVLAEYFGIYGNTVVVDHGCGLASLYAHLSSIGVEAGQSVVRGETLGQSGETGLAGGDHLHFSMLLHGTQVDPLEWWDPSWIRNRVFAKLQSETPSR